MRRLTENEARGETMETMDGEWTYRSFRATLQNALGFSKRRIFSERFLSFADFAILIPNDETIQISFTREFFLRTHATQPSSPKVVS